MRKAQKDLLPHPKIALSTPFLIFGRKRKGVALIVTVGVLAMLVLVGTSFAVNMLMDLRSSRDFKNAVEAKYLAEAGINRAVAELLYGSEGFINDAVDSTTEIWAGDDVFTTDIGNGSYTVTKIYDCAGQIYLNDDNPNLSAILENLVAALGAPLVAGDGAAIVANKPAVVGYTTEEEVIEALPGATLSDKKAKYDKIKEHITAQAFIDNDVISASSPYTAAPRAPVNVNTASREVLIAVLTGVSDGTNTVTAAEAGSPGSLADHLINNRPYGTYDQLWSVLLSAETLGYISDGDAAVIMANANPNTDLMRVNSNYSWRYKHVSKGDPEGASGYDSTGVPFAVDKTALTAHTTEFCFNSGGYYEINATGVVRDASGSQVASKSVQAVMKLFDIWKQTSQAQFSQGIISNLDLFPEFDQASSGISPAAYDGQIVLSTLKETSPGAGTPHFRLNFTDKDADGIKDEFNADSAAGDSQRQTSGITNPNPREESVVATPQGALFPDGVFFGRDEPQTLLWFYPENNIDSTIGSIEAWFKINWHYAYTTFVTYNAGKVFEAKYSDWNTGDLDVYISRSPSDPDPDKRLGFICCRTRDKNNNEYTMTYLLINSAAGDHPWLPGTWHHIAVTWNYNGVAGDPNYRSQRFYIDGIEQFNWNMWDPPNPFQGYMGLEIGHDGNGQEPPNLTMSEVRIFPDVIDGATIGLDCARGVYYDNGDATFTSCLFNAGTAKLGTVSWTEHISDESGNPIVPGADIDFDVFDGSNWLGNSSSRSNPAGNPLNVITAGGGDIKYRIYFKENGSGLFDTPVLDDVTITYQKRAKILYWRDV